MVMKHADSFFALGIVALFTFTGTLFCTVCKVH